jgi:hypothetical protein
MANLFLRRSKIHNGKTSKYAWVLIAQLPEDAFDLPETTEDNRNNEFSGNISVNKTLGLNRVIIQIGQPIDDITNNQSIEDILLGVVDIGVNKPLLINKSFVEI